MRKCAVGLSAMRYFIFLFAVALFTTGCVQAPKTLAIQCITGSAQWTPITLDFAHPVVGGNPAVITDDAVESVYLDPRGNRAIEPGRYTGECYVRNRPF